MKLAEKKWTWLFFDVEFKFGHENCLNQSAESQFPKSIHRLNHNTTFGHQFFRDSRLETGTEGSKTVCWSSLNENSPLEKFGDASNVFLKIESKICQFSFKWLDFFPLSVKTTFPEHQSIGKTILRLGKNFQPHMSVTEACARFQNMVT